MSAFVLRAIWPVLDPTASLQQLTAEADLEDVARIARARITGRVRWALRHGQDVPGSGGAHTVLVAEAPAERLRRPLDPPDPDLPPVAPTYGPSTRAHLDDLEHLLRAGETRERIAQRLGVQPDSLYAACLRNGRDDLVAVLKTRYYADTGGA